MNIEIIYMYIINFKLTLKTVSLVTCLSHIFEEQSNAGSQGQQQPNKRTDVHVTC